MNEKNKYFAAIDIGYSNLKSKHGFKGSFKESSIPATAIQKEKLGYSHALKEFKGSETIEVIVDGDVWVVGISPYKLGSGKRELNRDFVKSKSYKAMYYGAISEMETDTIDVLVTGLPVDQSFEKELVAEMKSWMTGVHKVGNKREITVKEVVILPQPAGAFMDFSQRKNKQRLIEKGNILIIDPGYYSVDHIMIEGGEYNKNCSGTSLHAVSAILQECADLIKLDYGRIDAESIEEAIQNNETDILVKGKEVDFSQYLKDASEFVSEEALNTIKQNIRDKKNIDFTLLVGGGGEYYLDKAKEKITNCESFEVAEESHMSVVRGYWLCAVEYED